MRMTYCLTLAIFFIPVHLMAIMSSIPVAGVEKNPHTLFVSCASAEILPISADAH